MSEPQPECELPERKSSWFSILDSVDHLIYAGLGLALLGWIAFDLGRSAWESGSAPAFGIFVAFVGSTLFAVIRDLRRGRLSGPSKIFIALWALCTCVIIILEFTS